MFGRVDTSAIVGIDGRQVIVEADFGQGLPSFDMVGFLSSEVREARERVKSAIKNSGITVPAGRLTVNLSPADLRKTGNSFDLPVALAILIALGILPEELCRPYLFVGELALDGNLRKINGTLSHVILARSLGKTGVIVPRENRREGALISGIEVYGFDSLNEVLEYLLQGKYEKPEEPDTGTRKPVRDPDFSEILGQEAVKRAAAVASAGMHGLLMIGPPGTGKTLTAKRIPSILPPLSEEEQIECSRIHSVAGLLEPDEGLVRIRPFRSPHHTVSASALVGGGSIPRPGEMSLAHNGVLFLDELPEFSKMTLEVMRQPLEDSRVVISRVHGSYVFPTRVMLVAAMNPCSCGYYPDRNRCHCSEHEVRRYLSRLSRPLLDRIDIVTEVPRVDVRKLETGNETGMDSAGLRAMVVRAWEIQKDRYRDLGILFNSQLSGREIRTFCTLGKEERTILSEAFEHLELSARAYDRILKVARTIADIDGAERIGTAHLLEAISYRAADRKFFGSGNQ